MKKPLENHKRSMMSGKSVYAARAAYHCLSAITNQNVMDNTFKSDYNAFIDSAITLSLNHATGTIQHKSAFMRHLITHKFQGKVFYSSFCKKTGIQNITSVDGNTDMRVMNELPVIQIYHNTFKKGIENIQANHDNVIGNFHAQKQTNQDFNVTIKSMFERITRPLSILNNALIIRPHDEKAGMGMFKHATRGTLGMLTYDSKNGMNVQVTSSPLEITKLISYDKTHLLAVKDSLYTDNCYVEDIHGYLFKNALDILKAPGKTFEEQQHTHKLYQQFMWDNFHSNPNYNRSISFIFPTSVEYNHFSENDPRFMAFRDQFCSLLHHKMYDLNKQNDCKDITFAMLRAYKETVDPKIIDKLQHLNHVAELTFNTKFILDLANMIKQGSL